ncbi:MAG: hypothetical protein O3B27_05270 [Actinomycetota bacterium]|jgi:hypothetical protein|nr:hypothetical protein [Actinomycetota bacterium]MDA2990952.1 hypothetical protein [Actinomycetota bacterium]
MTTATDDRQTVAGLADEQDWQRRISDDGRVDVFNRGTVRIRAIWQGEHTLSGASLFHDEMYESYTRDVNTLRAWFKR